jgi:FixJ family two-component response regulator
VLDSTQSQRQQRHVFIVDDDVQTLRAFARILHVEGFDVDTFHSASDFLKHPPSDVPSCLVLDLRLPEIDGLQLQQLMRSAHADLPIIFVSGYGDVPSTASAMRYGAVDFLEKPVEGARLLDAVSSAVALDAVRRGRRRDSDNARKLLAELTPRERQVCDLVARGLLNKQIADEIGASERTVKIHRGRAIQKLGIMSVTDLVRLLSRIGE